jgi:hypothetical protein
MDLRRAANGKRWQRVPVLRQSVHMEDTVISSTYMQVTRPVSSSSPRVFIVYRTALLRDSLVRVLTDGGLSVVGAIQETQLDGSLLQALNPDVIVFEEAEADSVRAAAQAIIFSPTSPGVKKVIVVGLGYLIIVAYQAEILHDASIEDLVLGARQEILGESRGTLSMTVRPPASN